MKKTNRLIYIIMIFTFLFISIMLSTSVCAYRSVANDFSNLINYPGIYTLVQELKTAHPTWNFTMLYTGLDWNSVIENETTGLHTRSLIYRTVPAGNIEDWICPVCGDRLYDNQNWYCASAKTVSYYMDPRNWVNENYIFSFESLGNNSSINKIEGIKAILSGTFMSADTISYIDTAGNTQTINKSYAQIIMEAAEKYNVSPYLLASRMKQEQGATGSSSVTGNTFTYTFIDSKTQQVKEVFTCTGLYNFFNVNASGNSPEEITANGLKYAQKKGWTTPELSIHGGAKFLKEEYIDEHQDSLYLQKYDIDPEGGHLYLYQYMQNVSAPYTEGLSVRSAYKTLSLLENGFNFIIPVYENMPIVASAKPGRTVTAVTESVQITTQSTGLSLRDKPSSSGEVITSMPKGTIVTRIELANEANASSGVYWDKVVYNNGSTVLIGYASREYLTQVASTQTVAEVNTISTMCNLRNGPATTQTTVKQILTAGTPVTVIDKMTFYVDGHIWYKVRLADGTEGYVSSAYLQQAPVTPTERYKIEGAYIKVAPNTTITEIPGAVLQGEVFGTGAKVILEGVEYTLVILGDVSGDGLIKSKDYMMIKNYIMGTLTLDEAQKLAADPSKDNEVKSKDYMLIKNCIMGISLISL